MKCFEEDSLFDVICVHLCIIMIYFITSLGHIKLLMVILAVPCRIA